MKPEDLTDEDIAEVEREAIGSWIVWERATDGGRPWIRAIDTTEERADQHVTWLQNCARVEGKPEPDLLVEESRLNHLYAASMIDAVVKREAKRRAKRGGGS